MYARNLLNYVFAASSLLPLVCGAAPPGVMQWQTLGSPFIRDCGGTYLSTIGWRGQSGVACANLQWNDPTLHTLNYFLGDLCEITLYSDEGCRPDTLVKTLDQSTEEHNACVEVPEGFRALSVTCTSDLGRPSRFRVGY